MQHAVKGHKNTHTVFKSHWWR